jgi:hypothetical protein
VITMVAAQMIAGMNGRRIQNVAAISTPMQITASVVRAISGGLVRSVS